ncbi:putative ribosome biogenesis GTPase RsgA [Halobacillus andaensis]|uniref:Small ribosomal subunit biogenesis GTPase RsgA n=1 Tax=Halobacillus andaensis TaxID=1176239 RepID=A0A917EU72_HALAA|nr:ribosome small subunit-dependent GTPase A [Halobacillus andaensis]MBP2003711.1 ribosome biogenesis GTPase [Halobacillus andaensis]GGF12638.1 putative ribosome biogenesis GTPase RsgA [Halobacillus andaensis]
MNLFTLPKEVASQLKSGEKAGLIARSSSSIFTIWTDRGPVQGHMSGKFRYESSVRPVVGDWVVIQPFDEGKAIVHRVLTRKTVLSRKEPGTQHSEQVIAANMDAVIIVTAMTSEFNLQRLERYVYQVYESGARPLIVCTKKDLCDEQEAFITQIDRRIPAVPVYGVSSVTLDGMEEFMKELQPSQTYALIGSSGVGKSTLINYLLGEDIQQTKQVRSQDDKGRHTTTHREMFTLQNGAVLIDTPGMREVQLWGDAEGVEAAFSDIEALASTCKFRDCKHESEPGCAVLRAIDTGELSAERVKNYHKLARELHRLDLKEKYGTHRANRILHGPNSMK